MDFIHLPTEICDLWLILLNHSLDGATGYYPARFARIALMKVFRDLLDVLEGTMVYQSVNDYDDIAIRRRDLSSVASVVGTALGKLSSSYDLGIEYLKYHKNGVVNVLKKGEAFEGLV